MAAHTVAAALSSLWWCTEFLLLQLPGNYIFVWSRHTKMYFFGSVKVPMGKNEQWTNQVYRFLKQAAFTYNLKKSHTPTNTPGP